MQQFLQQLINGLSVGAIYALIAVGYTMVYGVLQLINFAHGDVFMVGAMAALFAATGRVPATMPWWLHVLILGGLAVAYLVMWLMGRPGPDRIRSLLPLGVLYLAFVPTLYVASRISHHITTPSWSGSAFMLLVAILACGTLGFLV